MGGIGIGSPVYWQKGKGGRDSGVDLGVKELWYRQSTRCPNSRTFLREWIPSMKLLPIMLHWIPSILSRRLVSMRCPWLCDTPFRPSLHNTHDIFRCPFPRRFHSKMTFTPGMSAQLECFDVHLNVVALTTSSPVMFHKSCASPQVEYLSRDIHDSMAAEITWLGWSILDGLFIWQEVKSSERYTLRVGEHLWVILNVGIASGLTVVMKSSVNTRVQVS